MSKNNPNQKWIPKPRLPDIKSSMVIIRKTLKNNDKKTIRK